MTTNTPFHSISLTLSFISSTHEGCYSLIKSYYYHKTLSFSLSNNQNKDDDRVCFPHVKRFSAVAKKIIEAAKIIFAYFTAHHHHHHLLFLLLACPCPSTVSSKTTKITKCWWAFLVANPRKHYCVLQTLQRNNFFSRKKTTFSTNNQ